MWFARSLAATQSLRKAEPMKHRTITLVLAALALVSLASTCEVGDTVGFTPEAQPWSAWNLPLKVRTEVYGG